MSHARSAAQRFKERDAASYDAVTDEFDRFVTRVSPPLATRMVALARVTRAERVLDVGTGTGIVALHAARAAAPEGVVVGVDLSERMLSIAREKGVERGLAGCLDFRRMDAESLELPDGSFDAVLSLFALLHFPDPLTALGEMRRVLRPGGRLVVAVGSRPPLFSLTGLAHYAGRLPQLLHTLRGVQLTAPHMLNALVEKHCPPPREPGETEVADGGPDRTRQLLALVRRAGFTNARWSWEGHSMRAEGAEEFWDVQRTFSSAARKRIAAAPPESVAALREEFIRRCRAVQDRGGRLLYPVGAFFVVARRPVERRRRITFLPVKK